MLKLFDRIIFRWHPSCWRSFTVMQRRMISGWSAGSTASAGLLTEEALALDLLKRLMFCSRVFHFWVWMIPSCHVEYTSFQPLNQAYLSSFEFFGSCVIPVYWAIFMVVTLLYFTVDIGRQSEGSSARMLCDQKILLGTTYDLMARAADRSPSVVETLGEDKVQKILQLSGSSSITQVMSYLGVAFGDIYIVYWNRRLGNFK